MLASLFSALASVSAAMLAAVVIAALMRSSRQSAPHLLTSTKGRIAPGKISAAIVVTMGFLTAVAGLAFVLYGEPAEVFTGFVLLITGLPCAGFMAPSLTHWHDVRWNSEGIEGPSRPFGPTLALSRTFIHWKDVVSTGETKMTYRFIQSEDGRRIYWSYLYRGHAMFEKLCEQQCARLTARK